jgi:CBS domain-containing protein
VLDAGKLAGILTESDLLHQLMTGRVGKDTIVAEVMERKVSTVALHASSSKRSSTRRAPHTT